MTRLRYDETARLRFLTREQVESIHEAALDILENTGVLFDHSEALEILARAGANVDKNRKIARFPRELVLDCIHAAPSSVTLYDTSGKPAVTLAGNTTCYYPGAAAVKILDRDGRTVRDPTTWDVANIARLTERLPCLEVQSSALIMADVPKEIADRYRLFVMLKNCRKPIITGAFSPEGLADMIVMLSAVAGGQDALEQRPLAGFAHCPSPPLMWTSIYAHSLIECARRLIPIVTISMPLAGATAPATLAGSVTIHTAETLSGIVLAQCVRRGAPVIYGGSPAAFEMRFGTTPMGAVETMMIDAAYTQMGKFYGLPTHSYTGIPDTKVLDMQAGLETGMGIVIGTLAGTNLISCAGMLDFESCQSLEKLVFDNDVCGMMKRLQRGIGVGPDTIALDLIKSLGPGGDYLSSEHTRRYFRQELFVPSTIIDRRDRAGWQAAGGTDCFQRAAEVVDQLLGEPPQPVLQEEQEAALDEVMSSIMRRYGIGSLPIAPRTT